MSHGAEVGVDWVNGLVIHEDDAEWHPWDEAVYGPCPLVDDGEARPVFACTCGVAWGTVEGPCVCEVPDHMTTEKGSTMTDELTAADFEMRYDADHTFPFVESEDAAIMAYGHPDAAQLAAQITEYDRLCTGPRYEVYETVPGDIRQTYAVLVEGKSGDEWYIRWGKSADEPGAFPVSVVVR